MTEADATPVFTQVRLIHVTAGSHIHAGRMLCVLYNDHASTEGLKQLVLQLDYKL